MSTTPRRPLRRGSIGVVADKKINGDVGANLVDGPGVGAGLGGLGEVADSLHDAVGGENAEVEDEDVGGAVVVRLSDDPTVVAALAVSLLSRAAIER